MFRFYREKKDITMDCLKELALPLRQRDELLKDLHDINSHFLVEGMTPKESNRIFDERAVILKKLCKIKSEIIKIIISNKATDYLDVNWLKLK